MIGFNVMRAILVRDEGPNSRLFLGEVQPPEIYEKDVLIKVRATSVNQADLLQRKGLYPPPPGASEILGLDISGTVAGVGRGVTLWREGDKVFGFVAGGGYGEFVVVNESLLWPLPPNLDFESAAAVGEVFATAYLNLFVLGGLKKGEKALIHGGSGGVGSAAIQLALNRGAEVFTTVATEEGRALCGDLGAHHVINYKKENFVERVKEITEGFGIDVVLDFVGAPYINKHLDVLSEHGRLVLIGLKGGTRAEVFLPPLLTKRLKIIGSTLRSLSFDRKVALVREFQENVLPLLKSGEVFPIIDSIFPISQVEEAHDRFLKSKHLGKIVLTWHTV